MALKLWRNYPQMPLVVLPNSSGPSNIPDLMRRGPDEVTLSAAVGTRNTLSGAETVDGAHLNPYSGGWFWHCKDGGRRFGGVAIDISNPFPFFIYSSHLPLLIPSRPPPQFIPSYAGVGQRKAVGSGQIWRFVWVALVHFFGFVRWSCWWWKPPGGTGWIPRWRSTRFAWRTTYGSLRHLRCAGLFQKIPVCGVLSLSFFFYSS